MPEYYKNSSGRVTGSVRQDGNKKVYSDQSGRVVAYVKTDNTGKQTTIGADGKYLGQGDQGMRRL